MKRCTRCILTENHADICFNEEGVCNYCLEFESTVQLGQPTQHRADEFAQIVEKHRGVGDYDCLAMLSGGKDSTYALYLLKKQYELNVLGFTFDNGFESTAALENVRRAIDFLEVDHLYFRPAHVKRMFHFLLRNGVKSYFLCQFCKCAMNAAAWEMAKRFGISLVVTGETKGQRHTMRRPMEPGRDVRIREAIDLLKSNAELQPFLPMYLDALGLYGTTRMESENIRFISPYHYLVWDPDKAMEKLKEAFGWEAPVVDYPRTATNCSMSLVNTYLSRQDYGFSWYDTEMSTLIRYGEMTREKALEQLEVEIEREVVNSVLSHLNLSLDDLISLPGVPSNGG